LGHQSHNLASGDIREYPGLRFTNSLGLVLSRSQQFARLLKFGIYDGAQFCCVQGESLMLA
jgi:hypothetical protein